ncbi:MAG: CBS domain-containing protein, partial [Desulfobacterales bacterium]
MWIERYITRKVITVGPRESLIKAKVLMASHCIRHLPVVDENHRLVGIISDRDLRSALPMQVRECIGNPRDVSPCVAIKAEDIMTRNPLTISPDQTLQDVLVRFRDEKVGAFPVLDQEERLVGILSDRDMLNGFIQLLGLGSPGTFLGVEVAATERGVKTVVDALTDAGFPIASMLVIRNWQPEAWAMFLYLLSQNLSGARRVLKAEGLTLIDP